MAISQEEKNRFKLAVAELSEKLGVEPAMNLSPDRMVIVMRAADFKEEDNEYWDDVANKSSARPDIECCKCHQQVMMSNQLYDKYKPMEQKPRVCCTRCFMPVLNELAT